MLFLSLKEHNPDIFIIRHFSAGLQLASIEVTQDAEYASRVAEEEYERVKARVEKIQAEREAAGEPSLIPGQRYNGTGGPWDMVSCLRFSEKETRYVEIEGWHKEYGDGVPDAIHSNCRSCLNVNWYAPKKHRCSLVGRRAFGLERGMEPYYDQDQLDRAAEWWESLGGDLPLQEDGMPHRLQDGCPSFAYSADVIEKLAWVAAGMPKSWPAVEPEAEPA